MASYCSDMIKGIYHMFIANPPVCLDNDEQLGVRAQALLYVGAQLWAGYHPAVY